MRAPARVAAVVGPLDLFGSIRKGHQITAIPAANNAAAITQFRCFKALILLPAHLFANSPIFLPARFTAARPVCLERTTKRRSAQ